MTSNGFLQAAANPIRSPSMISNDSADETKNTMAAKDFSPSHEPPTAAPELVPSPPPPTLKMRGRRNPSGPGMTLVDSKQGSGGKGDSFYNLSITPHIVERKMSQQNRKEQSMHSPTSPQKKSILAYCGGEATTDNSDSSSLERGADLEMALSREIEDEEDICEDEDDFHEESDEFDADDNDSFMSSDSSHDSSGSNGYCSSGEQSFNSKSNGATDKETIKIAKIQARIVLMSRLMVISTLVLLGGLLIFAVMSMSSRQEEEAFQRDFDAFSNAIGKSWQTSVASLFVSLDALAVDVILATTSMTWPLVTVPNYAVYGASLRNNAPSVVSTALLPVVSQRDRMSYERYILDNLEWINATLEWQEKIDKDEQNQEGTQQRILRREHEEVSFVDGVADQIYTIDPVSNTIIVDIGPSPYYPVRAVDPLVDAEAINYNLASSPHQRSIIVNAFMGQEASLGQTVLNVEIGGERTQPTLGTMTYPILDSFSNKGKVVGVLSTMFDWTTLMEKALPEHCVPVSCVFENSCNQTFTILLSNEGAFVLGEGDLHDEAFDSYGRGYTLFHGLSDLPTSTLSKVSFDDKNDCQYTMTIYPTVKSSAVYASDVTKDAAAITGVVFLFVLVVFGAFDCVQERRNRKLKRTAQEARAIVSSLFPANVRDRLFETNREKEKLKRKERRKEKRRRRKEKKRRMKTKAHAHEGAPTTIVAREDPALLEVNRDSGFLSVETVQQIMIELEDKVAIESDDEDMLPFSKQNTGFVSHPKHRLKTYLKGSPISQSGGAGSNGNEGMGNPIADLFPHTTVLFADIVGFTAWSSEREPEQVFALLQTLYQSFDKIAKKRGVFKVETIGDCYVAVTGLPEPQLDHAVRMTKFAKECMAKMEEVTKQLELSLGPDTSDLCLRCGLNSGPVTAGVLIGEKSRFQLFGDTVNTASRMESTGEPNKIQVSSTTADQLKKAGKTYWVRPREDLVHAKGKGNIQTFWIATRNTTGYEGLQSAGLRRAPSRQMPCRTQSMMNMEPVRGVHRTTSDSQGKMLDDSFTASIRAVQPTDTLDQGREQRLVQWQVEMFTKLLKKIVAARMNEQGPQIENPMTSNKQKEEEDICEVPLNDIETRKQEESSISNRQVDSLLKPNASLHTYRQNSTSTLISADSGLVSLLGSSNGDFSFSPSIDSQPEEEPINAMGEEVTERIVVDEVAEVIYLPQFTPEATKAMTNVDAIVFDTKVVTQLQDFIATVAHMYRNNPFHNFEHASHVTMSATKLLNRIVVPENIDYDRESNDVFSDLHDYTYGITSDPLTQFAVVFSALIHDVDHYGVPNGQLAKENPEMAALYRDKSIAEQNSVDLAWDLLSDPMYKDLRHCIACSKDERKRFRQLVVNSVMATDIFDKDMKELRNSRWDKAFHSAHSSLSGQSVNANSYMEVQRNMKATIVIEHIIQASDVAHTMQHWHIYTKWNERLFREMYSAFDCGRSEKNPAEGWYKGELWFFDNYVIPLAKKLEECRVFGVASDECLNYATANRNEWEAKGEEIVSQMVARYQKRTFFVTGRAKTRASTRKKSNTKKCNKM